LSGLPLLAVLLQRQIGLRPQLHFQQRVLLDTDAPCGSKPWFRRKLAALPALSQQTSDRGQRYLELVRHLGLWCASIYGGQHPLAQID
jgi:hypothetical protein